VLLGTAVLLAIGMGLAWSFTLDGPIRAPLAIEGRTYELFRDRSTERLPLGDWPCEGRIDGPRLICSPDVVLRTDLDLGLAVAPIYRLDGSIYAGGAVTPNLGILVYPTSSGTRFTTSARTARKLRGIGPVRLFFGHERPR
jgi:hypothetical protein